MTFLLVKSINLKPIYVCRYIYSLYLYTYIHTLGNYIAYIIPSKVSINFMISINIAINFVGTWNGYFIFFTE